MLRPRLSNPRLPRTLVAAAFGLLCLMIVAAPFLAALPSWRNAAAALYLFFSCICHQNPERSFMLSGFPFAVCHRCSGIYIGMFIGSLFENCAMHRSTEARRIWVLCAAVPMVVDALAPLAGLWASTAATRFSTGLLFGILISSLLARGLKEFLDEAPWRRLTMQNSQLKGGLS